MRLRSPTGFILKRFPSATRIFWREVARGVNVGLIRAVFDLNPITESEFLGIVREKTDSASDEVRKEMVRRLKQMIVELEKESPKPASVLRIVKNEKV